MYARVITITPVFRLFPSNIVLKPTCRIGAILQIMVALACPCDLQAPSAGWLSTGRWTTASVRHNREHLSCADVLDDSLPRSPDSDRLDKYTAILYSNPVRITHAKEDPMPIQRTYTQARAHLAKLLDEVTDQREVVIIQRRGADDVAMIAADELASLLETAHLLRSPVNAERLLTALARARGGSGIPQSVAALQEAVGLAEKA
jgi:antitoxin YefM